MAQASPPVSSFPYAFRFTVPAIPRVFQVKSMTKSMTMSRNYKPLLDQAPKPASRLEAMNLACDLLWDAFGPHGKSGPNSAFISWVGFYEKVPHADEMILLARRDKPACSPIGLHGACGRSWSQRVPLLVGNVKTLGEGYIACDPRDQSELVVPLFHPDGACWGVLDADSFETDAFDRIDVDGTTALLERLGLTTSRRPAIVAL